MRISIPIEKTEEGNYKISTPQSEIFKPVLEKLKDYQGTVTIVLDTPKTDFDGSLFECQIKVKWGGVAAYGRTLFGSLNKVKGELCDVLSAAYNDLLQDYNFYHPWQVDGMEPVEVIKHTYAPIPESEMSKKLRSEGFSQTEINAILEEMRDNDRVI